MLKRCQAIVALAFLMVFSTSSFSAYTAAELKSDCKIAIEDFDQYHHEKFENSHLQTGRCIGYVSGILDSYNYLNTPAESTHKLKEVKNYFCIDKSVSKQEIIKNLITGIEKHPDVATKSAAFVVIDILDKDYPCKSKQSMEMQS